MKSKTLRKHKQISQNKFMLNQKMFLLLIVFVIGLIFGSVCIRNLDSTLVEKVQNFINNYFIVQSQQSILLNFLSVLANEILILFVPFVFGLCLIGEPVMWIEPVIRGLGIGLISGYMYRNYNINGMKFYSVVILIPLALSSAIMLIACHESILMTRDIKHTLKNSSEMKENYIKLYIIRYVVLLVAVVVISVISSLNVYFFSAKFNLQF